MTKFYGQNSLVCFASKAFCCKEIFKIIQQEALGIDTVSIGEMFTAIEAGFNPKNIYLHGNNKSVDEIKYAIKNKIGKIVVDNFGNFYLIQNIVDNPLDTMDEYPYFKPNRFTILDYTDVTMDKIKIK